MSTAMERFFDHPRVTIDTVDAVPRERSGKFKAFKRTFAREAGLVRRSGEGRHDR